jgi:putative nucleotidyltransferase with HDIG domain
MFSLLLKLKRRIKKLLRVQTEARQIESSTIRSKYFKFLLLVLFAVLVGVFYPGDALYDPLDMPHVGEIASEDLIAPFQITVYKTDRELREEKDDTRISIPYIIDYDTSIVSNSMQGIKRLFDVVESLKSTLDSDTKQITDSLVQIIASQFPLLSRNAIEKSFVTDDHSVIASNLQNIFDDAIYSIGVLPEMYSFPESRNKTVLIQNGDNQQIISQSRLYTISEANSRLLTALNKFNAIDSIDVNYYYSVGRSFIQPNLHVNNNEYNRRVDEAINSISDVKEIVEKGTIVLRSGQKIKESQQRVLQEMVRIQRSQAIEHGWLTSLVPVMARIGLVLAAFIVLYLFLFYFRKDIYKSNPKIFAIYLVFALQLFLLYMTSILIDRFDLTIYIYPIALLPIMITILFDAEIGILSTVVLAFLFGVLQRFDYTLAFLAMVIGTVGCFASRRVRKRSDFFKIMYFISFTFIIFIFLIENLKLTPGSDIFVHVGFGVINGVVVPLLAIGLLPIFESLFSITTDITLLELSDLNHPLLKRLSIEAPGTYHHSIIVGTLTEAGAKAIGGNSLLARVGAYFHDIGKMEIPEYFVENQFGLKSKHEELTPSMSSIILSSHVKKGRILGEEADIPDDILNFIEEHHGTMVQTYFYSKAKEMGEEDVSPDKFRYPGPKPQIRETGIAMLADAVEAASRTLDDPKPARINNLIQNIINDRFKSGELDECPLTLKDLAKIKEAFAQILMGTFHQRIVYPHQDKSDD